MLGEPLASLFILLHLFQSMFKPETVLSKVMISFFPICSEMKSKGRRPPTHRIAFNSLYLFSLGLLSMKQMERYCIITRVEKARQPSYPKERL